MYNGSCSECNVWVRGRGVRGRRGGGAGYRGAGICWHAHGPLGFAAAICPAAAVCELPGVSIIQNMTIL